MDSQTPIDYEKLFASLVQRCSELTRERDEIETEIAKLRQLIIATFPLIPEEKQKVFQKDVDDMEEESGLGLLEAIKLVFSTHKGEWLTVSNVRDYLEETGFEFRRYRANPLASIATTLKRMVPTVLESTNTGSGTLYRRRLTLGDRIAEAYKLDPLPDSYKLESMSRLASRPKSEKAKFGGPPVKRST